jgi:Reverse transcriptase (RNA-dependent DNA polymerase)
MNFISTKVFQETRQEAYDRTTQKKNYGHQVDRQREINLDGTINYKARCVSRGFMQKPGVNYTGSFAPVASYAGIRVVIGIFYILSKRFQEMHGCWRPLIWR